MNLREEIKSLPEGDGLGQLVSMDEEVESIVRLFKKWALEIVGQDSKALIGHGNQIRQEIRQRIEESIPRGGENDDQSS